MASRFKFIHITDLHLTPPGTNLYGLSPHERFDRCLSDIEAWHADAEFCIITGDLADAGDPQAYAWLAARLAAFSLPCHLMIGNHDRRDAFSSQFQTAPLDDNGFVQQAFDTPAGRFILMDTFKAGTSAGEYCGKRQAWLQAELKAAQGMPTWLFMHHPPFDISIDYMDRIKLEDHEALANMVDDHGDIRHIFYGHVHRPGYVNWRGVPCTSLPATNHQVPLSGRAVTGKPYSDEPPMYAVVLIEDTQVTIHFDAYDHRGDVVMPPPKP